MLKEKEKKEARMMDSTKMTILIWQDGNVSAPKGTIALLVIQDYELFDFGDYKEQGIVTHIPPRKITAFGLSLGNRGWKISRVDSCNSIAEGDFIAPEESGRIIRWAALPYDTEEDGYEELTGNEAEEAVRKTRYLPFSKDGTAKYIPDNV